MARLLYPFLALVIACSIAACNRDAACNVEHTTYCPSGADSTSPTEVEVSTATLFIDATPSLRGYADAGSPLFTLLPDIVIRSVHPVPSDSVSFMRFGVEQEAIARNRFRSFGVEPTFYRGGPGFHDTRIDEVVRTRNPNALSVVITDLFQDGADANLVSQSLTDTILSEGGAVGVVGVRVPFDGMVYDVGVERSSFSYEGDRPLYLLVIGPLGAVTRFVDSIEAELEGVAEARTLVTTPRRVLHVSTNENARVDSATTGVNETGQLATCGDGTVEPFQFRVLEDEIAVYTAIHFVPVAHGATLVPENLTANLRVHRMCEDDIDRSDSGSTPIRSAFGVEVRPAVGSDAQVIVTLTERELPSEGLYAASVVVTADGERATELPGWVAEWDMNVFGQTPDGSKTLNLRTFLSNLAQHTATEGDPTIARLDYLFYVGG